MAKCLRCGKSLLFRKSHPYKDGYCFECGEIVKAEEYKEQEIQAYLYYPQDKLIELLIKTDRYKSPAKLLEVYNDMVPYVRMYLNRCKEHGRQPNPFIYDYMKIIKGYVTVPNLFPKLTIRKEQSKYAGDNSAYNKEVQASIMKTIEYKVTYPDLNFDDVLKELENASL